VQLSKARAAAEASRKQLESMQDKMLEAERRKREEEVGPNVCTKWPYLQHAHVRDLVAWKVPYDVLLQG